MINRIGGTRIFTAIDNLNHEARIISSNTSTPL